MLLSLYTVLVYDTVLLCLLPVQLLQNTYLLLPSSSSLSDLSSIPVHCALSIAATDLLTKIMCFLTHIFTPLNGDFLGPIPAHRFFENRVAMSCFHPSGEATESEEVPASTGGKSDPGRVLAGNVANMVTLSLD